MYMSNYSNLPAPTPDGGLSRYLQQVRKFPMLEPEEEYMLAKRWVDHEDTDAAHRLVTSHLRLAAKIAMGYRGYGLPQSEVISEANVGLMQAVKKFDPNKGFTIITAGNRPKISFLGKDIIEFSEGKFEKKSVRLSSKIIMRTALDYHLGNRSLNIRKYLKKNN